MAPEQGLGDARIINLAEEIISAATKEQTTRAVQKVAELQGLPHLHYTDAIVAVGDVNACIDWIAGDNVEEDYFQSLRYHVVRDSVGVVSIIQGRISE
jgi:hypothetical protein